MKKTVSLLLVLVVILCMCSCNNKSAEETPVERYTVYDSAKTTDQKVVEFETVLAEDDNVKIELLSFVEEKKETADGPTKAHKVSIKVHNKSNHDLTAFLHDSYIGDESAYRTLDSAPSIPAGKSDVNRYTFYKEGSSGGEPLDSIDDLYRLNGTFHVVITADNKYVESDYELPFSFENLERK